MPNLAAPLVRVERGAVEEAIHLGHLAVVDTDGRVHASLGDPGHVAYFRSCAKPFQAIGSLSTGIAARYELSTEHIAIMAASHSGEPRHVEIVRDLLRRTGIAESALQCGAHWPYDERAATAARRQMDEPLAVFNNCSGKHAGMLAAARALDAPLETYLDPAHPVQQRIRGVIEAFTGGRLLAKGGAAGAHCTGDRRSKLGLAVKFDSGDGTWTAVAVVAALGRLGWLDPGEREALSNFAHPTLRNHKRQAVGTVR